MIPTLLPALEPHGRLQLSGGEQALLLAVSAATIDRMLGDRQHSCSVDAICESNHGFTSGERKAFLTEFAPKGPTQQPNPAQLQPAELERWLNGKLAALPFIEARFCVGPPADETHDANERSEEERGYRAQSPRRTRQRPRL
jgi:hypothetical protein